MIPGRHAAVLLSGGLDSTVAATLALSLSSNVRAITILYGQRARREVDAARRIAAALEIPHSVVHASIPWAEAGLTSRRRVTPLVSNREQAFLPARNLLLLSIAAAATACSADIVLGTNASDAYTDATSQFFEACAELIALSGTSHDKPRILTPLHELTKADIVHTALELGAPLNLTWSCYEDFPRPCGMCVACASRAKAFSDVGVVDPALATVHTRLRRRAASLRWTSSS